MDKKDEKIESRLLTDEEISEAFNKFYEREIYSATSILPSDRAIATAQLLKDQRFERAEIEKRDKRIKRRGRV